MFTIILIFVNPFYISINDKFFENMIIILLKQILFNNKRYNMIVQIIT